MRDHRMAGDPKAQADAIGTVAVSCVTEHLQLPARQSGQAIEIGTADTFRHRHSCRVLTTHSDRYLLE